MFSGALTITDLNDFITPSQACIKPVEEAKSEKVDEPGAAATQIQVDHSGVYYEVPTLTPGANAAPARRKLEQAQISLNDCLACSGCITSAESVLITLQSHDEVRSVLSSNPEPSHPNHRVLVLSIAPQSLASLAAAHGLSSPYVALERVRAYGHALGFAYVIDTTFSRHIALREHIMELEERREVARTTTGEEVRPQALPMLASACPGWVCYAEKTHAEMLPFIAQTRSPQAVTGTLVKEWAAVRWGKRPEQIYHVSVMPCYDKKLEASRTDFYNAAADAREVDCVLTTGELDALLRQAGHSMILPPTELPQPHPTSPLLDLDATIPSLVPAHGSSSGGYLHTVLRATQLQNPESTVEVVKSTPDAEEIILRSADGNILFRAARCFGFRNIQNMVRRIGREVGVHTARGAAGRMGGAVSRRRAIGAVTADSNKLDYVEVMACPGGCVNGGGQLPPTPSQLADVDVEGYPRDWEAEGVRVQGYAGRWGGKEWTAKVERTYWGSESETASSLSSDTEGPRKATGDDEINFLVERIVREMCGELPESQQIRRKLLRTVYQAVESEVLGIAVKW